MALGLALFVGLVATSSAALSGSRLPVPSDLPGSAGADAAQDQDEARLRAHLLIDPAEPSRVGVLFEVDPGWHLYWRNPGDSGLATKIEFSAGAWRSTPAQQSDELEWPTPYAFSESFEEGESLTTYGYGGQVLLRTRLSEPLEAGQALAAKVGALVCKDQCIPASLSLSRVVPGSRSEENRRRSRAIFEEFAARLPLSAEAAGARIEGVWEQSALRPGGRLEGGLLLEPCASEDCVGLRLGDETPSFFPDEHEGIRVQELGARLVPGAPQREALALLVEAHEEDAHLWNEEGLTPLRGVLVTRDDTGRRRGVRVEVLLPVAHAESEVESVALPWVDTRAAARERTALPFLSVLWLAFVGGLILNLMPCVLPVLAIKVFSVADLAHRSRRDVLAHGAAYSLGILLTMLTLAAGVIALRNAGRSVGWGFQFQEPLFVAFVCSVVVVFALNLLGVFEIRFNPGKLAEVGTESVGARRSFFEGLLAVVLATPCSAPFLGTAVGFAFSSSALEILAVFAAIGVGLAAPYALVTAVPAWSHIIPRPGPWMVKLRAALGFLLLGSAVWLVWVFGRGAGLDAVSGLLAFLVFAAFLCWLYGSLPDERPIWMPAGIGLALLGVAALAANGVSLEAGDSSSSDTLGSPYDANAVTAELAGGRSVFSYFTADWCITCKVNEKRVLARPDVHAELDRLDVAVFRGDWTQRDEAIRAELARYGKAGVPVYVVHHPNAPDEPIVLPELLTTERLFAALASASK